MGHGRTALAVVLVLVGCGKDTTFPPPPFQTDVTLQLAWGLTEEPGFTDARYELYRADYPDTGTTWTLIQEGAFVPQASPTVSFKSRCQEDIGVEIWDYGIIVSGRFPVYADSAGYEDGCRFQIQMPRCAAGFQSVIAERQSVERRMIEGQDTICGCTIPGEPEDRMVFCGFGPD